MLAVLFGLIQCQPSSHPSKWSDQKLNEWFESGQYLNGLQMLPDPSIDRRSFAEHYYDHRENWDKAFAFLKNSDFSQMELGRIELGGSMFATVSEYLPKDREVTLIEAHEKYIDIQYVVSGNELIDIAPLKDMAVTIPYDSGNDIAFGTVPEFSELKASPERFFIFFPNIAHRPGLKAENDSELIRKVVVKVPVENYTEHAVTLTARDFIFSDDRPFKECHASSLLRLDDGNFLAVWFGGTKEKNPDVGIWMSKGLPGKWSVPQQVAKIRNDAHWNPVLFGDGKGTVYLYFKVGKEIPTWETWVMTSNDDGATWSEPAELVEGDKGGRGPVRNKPIILSDGVWLAGASHEDGTWEVFVDRSEDNGKTWQTTPYLTLDRSRFNGKGVIQPTLWESSPGNVHMLVRSTNGKIYRSDSEDYGKTWCALYATDMPNNNSGVDLVKVADSTLVLAYNPVSGNWASRALLNLAISYDNGLTWPETVVLENDANQDAEYSYPAIISYGNRVALTYTWKRQRIVFWELIVTNLKKDIGVE